MNTIIFTGCREMSRGYDWVKFLVDLDDGISSGDVARAYSDYAGWPRAELQKSGLWNDRIVFKFKTKPYGTEANDFYRHIADFGNWAKRRLEPFDAGIDFDGPPSDRDDTDSVLSEIENDCGIGAGGVKSLLSRITG